MTESTVWWLALGGAAIVLELLNGTFYLLMVATGLLVAALASYLGFGVPTQLVLAAIVSIASVFGWRHFGAKRSTLPARSNPDVNPDIGSSVFVEHWHDDGTATVRYRGASWKVAARAGASLVSGKHRIVEVVGSQLIVEKI
ncbi:MAG: NfeD family protein [Burkholderiaceae bacterium]|jgi:membrane protein implicated in regulation of membrane protease activity|nr:NfeD family protein [Burkholderiaceae bacterium]